MKIKNKASSSWIFLSVLTLSLLAAGSSGGQSQNIDRNQVLKEQYRIKKQLHPSLQSKISQAVESFKENFLTSGEESQPVFVASQVVRDQFRTVSPTQARLLGFYVLCQATSALEEDIRLITAEIEKMNRAKEQLDVLIASIEEQIEKKTEEGAQESVEEREEETAVVKEYETLETAPHFKAEYPKSPEIIYSKELEKMSLSELNNDMYYIKTALNSVHSTSKIAVEALRKEMDLRDRFLLELYFQCEEIINIDDADIKSIR